MASNEWFYTKGGKSYPPVTWNVLVEMVRAGQLDPTDQIWNDSLPRWVPAGAVEGLFAPNFGRYESRSVSASRQKSWLGAISLIMGIVFCIAEIVFVVAAGILSARPGGMNEKSPEAVLLGLLIISGCGGAFLGAVLGLIALFQPQSNKIVAVLGIAINGMCLLAVIGLIILGQMVS